jgi:hypothetical protein
MAQILYKGYLMKTILETKKSTDWHTNINVLLNSPICTNKLKVEFALYCAKDSLQQFDAKKYPKEYQNLVSCLELVGKWLTNSEKVSEGELKAAYAANAAVNFAAGFAADAAGYVADAAVSASNAAAMAAANTPNNAAIKAAVNSAAWSAADAAVYVSIKDAAVYVSIKAAAMAAARAAAWAAKQKEYLIYLIKLILREFNYKTTTFTTLFESSV